MAKHGSDRTKIVQILSESPLVGGACKKVGIARSTFYRWMKDNPDFRNAVDRALESGRSHLCEFAESSLLKKIKEGDIGATKFFLSNNDPRYIPKRSVYMDPPPTEEERRLIEMVRYRKKRAETSEWLDESQQLLERFMKEKLTPEERSQLIEAFGKDEKKSGFPLDLT